LKEWKNLKECKNLIGQWLKEWRNLIGGSINEMFLTKSYRNWKNGPRFRAEMLYVSDKMLHVLGF
jgi:hypothetical protein